MTVTTNENAPGTTAHTVVVRDQYGPLKFVGETIADLSWTYDAAAQFGHDRWTDITLYRVLDESSEYAYAIQIMGRSVLYHKPGGVCHRGITMPVSVLAKDVERYQALKACSKCRPAELNDLDDGDKVAVEENLPTLHRCHNAAEVIDVMYTRSKREKRSGLSMKLLQTASTVDEDIAAAMMKMREL